MSSRRGPNSSIIVLLPESRCNLKRAARHPFIQMQSFKIFAFLSFSLAIAWGQSGTVKSEGQPIPGATVRATQGDRALITVTDANGTFTLDKMTPGTWTVDVDMFGFEAS